MIYLLAIASAVAYSAIVGASAALYERRSKSAKQPWWRALAWPLTLPAFVGHWLVARKRERRTLPRARVAKKLSTSRGRK